MIDYKKVLKKRKTREAIMRFMKFLPDSTMLKIEYCIKLGRKLNLKDPQRFTEKIQWIKINYRKNIMAQITDKYSVRSYIEKCGLSSILNECYGVYNSMEEIDFSSLPNQFVIKDTLGSGSVSVIIVKDKDNVDFEKMKGIINKWVSKKNNELNDGREWAYHSGEKHRIIVEKYLSHDHEVLADFKFLCFDGEPFRIVHDKDRFGDHKRTFFDLNWNKIEVRDKEYPIAEEEIPKPQNLDKMIEIARTLSKGFPVLRVDLYNLEGKIVFGELTCYPYSGLIQFDPDVFDYELGSKFNLPRECLEIKE